MALVSSQAFASQVRLKKAPEFKRVFRCGYKKYSENFKLFFARNDGPFSRVGLAVPKKVYASAVNRNTVKRLIRESFRHTLLQRKGWDIVVVATKRPKTMVKQCLRNQLDSLWLQVEKSCKK